MSLWTQHSLLLNLKVSILPWFTFISSHDSEAHVVGVLTIFPLPSLEVTCSLVLSKSTVSCASTNEEVTGG